MDASPPNSLNHSSSSKTRANDFRATQQTFPDSPEHRPIIQKEILSRTNITPQPCGLLEPKFEQEALGHPNQVQQTYCLPGSPQQEYFRHGYQRDGYPGQGCPQQGYNQQEYLQPGYHQPGYPQTGYPHEGYPHQGYPPQGYPPQGYPQQGMPQQGYDPRGYPPHGHPPHGFSPQGTLGLTACLASCSGCLTCLVGSCINCCLSMLAGGCGHASEEGMPPTSSVMPPSLDGQPPSGSGGGYDFDGTTHVQPPTLPADDD